MTMLRVLAADPQIERYMKDKIIALDNEIEFYMKMDHKYRNCCVPFDLTELSPNNRMQDQPNATKQEGKP
jgi:hypothetical protein